MAYNRRNSAQSRSRASHEDAHLTSPTSPQTSGLPPLSPPRPFFLQRSAGDRGSYSSADTLDTGSDSDSVPPVASPTSPSARAAQPQPQPQIRQRNHKRRSQQQAQPQGYAPVESGARDPFATPGEEPWSPTSLYEGGPGSADSHNPTGSVRAPNARAAAPPSSFAFGYQQADAAPGISRPGVSRRSSVESIRRPPSAGAEYASYPPNSPSIGHSTTAGGYGALAQGSPSATDLTHGELGRPNAPFMGPGQDLSDHSRRSSFHSAIHETSAAGAMATLEGNGVPRMASVTSFRAPFLSPASRPGSSFWAPPSFPYGSTLGGSGSAVGLARKAPMPSTRIAAKLTKEEKPWIGERDTPGRISWWLTVAMMFVGVAVGALIIYQGYTSQQVFKHPTCTVLDDDYRTISSLDPNTWNREVQLGGFGNGEFEAMSNKDENLSFDSDGMHIRPTLVAESDFNGDWSQIFDGGSIKLDGCTVQNNDSACAVTASGNKTILNPAYSARINTKGLKSIQFGRVEIKARLPVGDWLWPAIWMLPEDDVYGGWPLSGEIDIMEARGNAPTYPNGGNNVIRSTLNYGPLPGLLKSLFGWQEFKRTSLAADFHTYALEWDTEFMRFYIDTRLHAMLAVSSFKGGFFKRGAFPSTAHNGTDTAVVVEDPWLKNPNATVPEAAPYDQSFYLIIDLAVGGTSGWFPDAVAGKPWYDNSGSKAMVDFAAGYQTWAPTWPTGKSRDFVIQSVKMLQLKGYGGC